MAEPAFRRSNSRSPRGPRQHGRRSLTPKASRHYGRRSRDRSYSDDYSDDYTDYSDSFVSDEDPYPSRRNKPATGPKYVRKPATVPLKKKKSKPSLQKATTNLMRVDQVTKAMQETRRMKYNEMKSELDSMSLKCHDLEEENKVLKRLQRRQEKALEKFEHEESDLPQLLQRHNNELRSLKDQLRKAREKNSRTERSLHEADAERDQLKRQVTKYRDLAEERGLPQRDEMHRRLLAAEADVQEKNKRVKELERHLENLTKNHKHQIGIEIARHRELQRKHEELTDTFNKIQIQLKEKEKELDIKNIYANRLSKRQPASYGGTPHESPSPLKADRQRRLSNSEATPRQKAKAYEQDRRQKEKNKTAADDKLAWEHLEFERQQAESLREEKERRDRENREMKQKEERAIRERVEREEQEIRLKVEAEEREKRQREERDRAMKEEKRLEEERERRRHEEMMERQRAEKEKQAQEERMRQEEERRAHEERERVENEAKLQEERRKKDDLLARLKALDSGSDSQKKEEKNAIFLTNDHESGTSSSASKKSAYSFSQVTENLHNGKPSHEEIVVPYLEKRRNRSLSTEEESGYQPSFTDSVFKEKRPPKNSFAVISNTKESPQGDITASQKARKNNLMNELFGKSRENSSVAPKAELSDLNDFLGPKTNSSPARKKFPWDEKTNHANGDKSADSNSKKPRNSSALFGGGSALIDDDTNLIRDQGNLLPLRTRQQPTTIQNKPTVNAVDNFDDDIEEVIL